MTAAHDWYYDFISPFAYLQWRRLRRDHPELPLRPAPVLLAGLLGHWGQLGPAEVPGKRLHTYRQVLWQARRMDIALRFPPVHPFNPLPLLRLALAAPDIFAATDRLFRFVWEEGRSADDANAFVAVGRELGVDDPGAAISRTEVKQQLADNGQAAIARGIFGVPTLVVGERWFWGNDSTDMALQYLADPAGFDDEEMRRVAALPIGVQRSGARA